MTSAYFFGWDYTINKQEKTAWQLVNRQADFLLKESIRITNRIESIRIANWNALVSTTPVWTHPTRLAPAIVFVVAQPMYESSFTNSNMLLFAGASAYSKIMS